jgi:glutaredoxin 3
MARIQLYTTRWCGYCVRAKTLLESRGISFEEISLDDDPDFRRRLLDLTGGWTVPQIVIDGRPIGATPSSGSSTAVASSSASPREEGGAFAPPPT